MGIFKRVRDLERDFAQHSKDHAWAKLLEDMADRVSSLEKVVVRLSLEAAAGKAADQATDEVAKDRRYI